MKLIKTVKITEIKLSENINEFNNIDLLKEEILKEGIKETITLKQVSNHFEVIAGLKTILALQALNYQEIEAIVLSGETCNNELIGKVKNTSNPIDVALDYLDIMQKEKLSQVELAKILGFKQSTIANKIRLLKLPSYIQDALILNKLTERHARALLKVKAEDLETIFNQIITKKLNVSQSEEYIANYYGKNKKGHCGSVKVASNSIKQVVELLQKSNMNVTYQEVDYQHELKMIIKVKK